MLSGSSRGWKKAVNHNKDSRGQLHSNLSRSPLIIHGLGNNMKEFYGRHKSITPWCAAHRGGDAASDSLSKLVRYLKNALNILIYCKFAVSSPCRRTVLEFACWSLPRQSLNPPRVATINQDQVIHNGWEGACQGTSWRDIKRRAVFGFRQICSDSPTHMDEPWVSSKVNTLCEPQRETFSSASRIIAIICTCSQGNKRVSHLGTPWWLINQ